MSRDEMESRISSYLDGELDDAEARVVRNLIDESDDWQACYDELRQTSQAVQGYFRQSEVRLSGDESTSSAAVSEIVRASTVSLRKSQIRPVGGVLRRRPVVFWATLIGVTAVVAVLAAWAMRGFGKPTLEELLADTADRLMNRTFEVKLAHPGPTGLERLRATVDPEEIDGGAMDAHRVWIGQKNRLHVLVRYSTFERHLGHDGRRMWTWRTGDRSVTLVKPTSPWAKRLSRWRERYDGVVTAVRSLTPGDVDLAWLGSKKKLASLMAEKPPAGPMEWQIAARDPLRLAASWDVPVLLRERRLDDGDFDISNWAAGLPLEEE